MAAEQNKEIKTCEIPDVEIARRPTTLRRTNFEASNHHFFSSVLLSSSAAMAGILTISRSLPVEIISHIISNTTPRDVCRFAAISTSFRMAADCDEVWEKFLPEDCEQVLAWTDCSVRFTSKKRLYFYLCQPLYLPRDKVCFWLEKSTGKKFYRLCPGKFTTSKFAQHHFEFLLPTRSDKTRMAPERVDIKTVHARGEFNTNKLSPRTNYAAYLLVKVLPSRYGEYSPPAELSVKLGDNTTFTRYSRLRAPPPGATGIAAMRSLVPRPNDPLMEIELGKFYNENGEDGLVVMQLTETNDVVLEELRCLHAEIARAIG